MRRTAQRKDLEASYLRCRMAPSRIRAIIVDDEEPARENLRLILDDACPEVEVIGMADGAASAEELIGSQRPDLVFLDIRMPSGTEGLELLGRHARVPYLVIFVTAYKDYAVQAFRAHAVDYLLKPIDVDELRAAVNKAAGRLGERREAPEGAEGYMERAREAARRIATHAGRIVVEHARGFKLFDPADIIRLEAQGNCTMLHFKDGSRYLDTRTLAIYDSALEEQGFLRVHRSHLIGLAHLREYLREEGHWAVMADGTRVPIARDRLERFLQRTH